MHVGIVAQVGSAVGNKRTIAAHGSVHRLHIKTTARRRWQDAGGWGLCPQHLSVQDTNPDCEAHNGGTTQPADGQGPGRDVHW